MVNKETILNEKDTQSNIIPLIGHGRGGSGDNWLNDFKVGAVFLYRPINNKNAADLTEGHILFKSKTASMILIRMPTDPDKGIHTWAHNLNFSRQMELVEVLKEGQDEEEEETPE